MIKLSRDIRLDKTKNKETFKKQDYWISYMQDKVSGTIKRNMVILLIGKPGSGKSYSGLEICKMVDPSFDVETRVIFKARELLELIRYGKLKPGSAILFEEVGIDMDSHKWQSIQNKIMKYLLETFRHRRLILIMTTPYRSYIAKGSRILIDAEFEAFSIDYEEQKCILKPKFLEYNDRSGVVYEKYLKIINKRGTSKLKHWRIAKPCDEMLDAYEVKKKGFTDALYEKLMKDIDGADELAKAKSQYYKCLECSKVWKPRNKYPTECPRKGCPSMRIEKYNGEDHE